MGDKRRLSPQRKTILGLPLPKRLTAALGVKIDAR
jgi:hypothetical protein